MAGVLGIHEADIRRFVHEVLMAHNIYRMRHNAQPLMLDDELSKACEECALEILASDKIESTRFPERGENLCILNTPNEEFMPTGDIPVTQWYNQRYDMDFSIEPEQNEKSVNFCQLVWKSSQFLGVGIARTATKIVVVCHYLPKGNIAGKSMANVSPELNPYALN